MTSSKVNYMDFEIIKEEWTECISSNDVKIKAKQPVMELTTEDSVESGKKKIKLGLSASMVSVMDSDK